MFNTHLESYLENNRGDIKILKIKYVNNFIPYHTYIILKEREISKLENKMKITTARKK